MSATAVSGGSASRGQPAAVVVSEQERHNAEDLAFDLRQMVRNGHIDEPQCRDLKEQCELEFSRWESLAQQAANREDFVEFERLTEIAHKLGDALRVYDEASRGDSRPTTVDRSASFGGQSARSLAAPVTQRGVSISDSRPPAAADDDMPPPPSLSAEKKSRKKKKKHQRRRSTGSFDDFDQPASGGDGGAGPQSTAAPVGEPSFPAFEGADAWGSVFPDPAPPAAGPVSVAGGADAVPPGSGAGVGPVPEPVDTEAVEKAKALEEENADLNERIETLSRQVSVAQSGMAMLQEQLTAAQKTINRQENEHAQLVDRLGKSVQIITKLRPMQGKAEVLEERLKKANEDVATQKEQLEAKDKVIKGLEAQLESKSKLLTETRQKLFSERDRVMAMNQEIANLRVANDEVQQEADQLASRAGMREKQLQRMRYIVDASGLVADDGGCSVMPSTSMLSQVAGTAPDLRTSTGMTMRNIPYSQASLNQRQQMLAGGGTQYSIPNTTANGVSPPSGGDSLSRIQSQATVADMKGPLFFRPTNDMDWGRTEVHALAQPISDQYRHMLTCGSGEYSGTIFEDTAVSVRMHCSVEGLGIDLKFDLVNKGASPLVQANLIAEPRKVTAFDFTIEPVPSRSPVIMGGAKREFTGRLVVKSPYEFPPVMCISYVLSDGTPVNNYIRIPLPIPKVAKPANPSSTVFFEHWRSEKFGLCEISSRISLRNEYTQAGGLAAVANAVEFGGNFARLAGLDSTARSVVVVGVIPFDTPAEVMARIEQSARHPGEARVEVRTPNVVLSRAVRNAIGEVLSSWMA
ncbi:hypothetical protein FOL47_011016 [Perkinsus chesapeaki]|uniref:Uncharacterized protein n=1 Tax=Perkinsus chesapeaki TaxID=330153 RepID=A0A7J6MNU4_PERCH|nr:hypothetical protein FOL47_011016 [Perkinsus chesapeaki]